MVAFAVITLVFAYTTVANIIERPEGVRIAALFIIAILVASLVSRVSRSFELRASRVNFDPVARELIAEVAGAGTIRVIANEPNERDEAEYQEKERSQRQEAHLPPGDPVIFLEVTLSDTSEFSAELNVVGDRRHGYRVLKVDSPAVANTVAAILLAIRDTCGKVPHVLLQLDRGQSGPTPAPVPHLPSG
jgi:hypothetical protein